MKSTRPNQLRQIICQLGKKGQASRKTTPTTCFVVDILPHLHKLPHLPKLRKLPQLCQLPTTSTTSSMSTTPNYPQICPKMSLKCLKSSQCVSIRLKVSQSVSKHLKVSKSILKRLGGFVAKKSVSRLLVRPSITCLIFFLSL